MAGPDLTVPMIRCWPSCIAYSPLDHAERWRPVDDARALIKALLGSMALITRHDPQLGIMIDDMQVRNLSHHTQVSYVRQVSQFARYFGKSPDLLGAEEIRTYQVYLTKEKKLAPGSSQIAVAALRFFYKVTLKREWNFEEILPLPKKPQKLPVILSREEVRHYLACVKGLKHRVILTTCYACRFTHLGNPSAEGPRHR
jgi:hypothetical protein